VQPDTAPAAQLWPAGPTQSADVARPLESAHVPADRLFRAIARVSGGSVLVITSFVGLFLFFRGAQALRIAGPSFLTTQAWQPDGHHFGIAAVLTGTLLIGAVAITLAMPLALGTALYISEYAPARIKRTLISCVDLMAAVPSVVYGLWGAFFLQGHTVGIARFLSTYLGWFPLFHVSGVNPHDPLATETVYKSSSFVAGMVVAMMITPVTCSIMREAFSQAPVGEREAALALGSTRWGMIRAVVLPFGRGGIIGGTMLGLGRALGETIAVYMIISLIFTIQPHLLQSGGSSVSSLIALRYGEATPLGTSALMAAGLVLFLITLVINFGASTIVARSRSGATSEA
jgi:phosphate transport system permease protein